MFTKIELLFTENGVIDVHFSNRLIASKSQRQRAERILTKAGYEILSSPFWVSFRAETAERAFDAVTLLRQHYRSVGFGHYGEKPVPVDEIWPAEAVEVPIRAAGSWFLQPYGGELVAA